MAEILTDKSLMPFGKHKGKALIDVPDDYFLWLYTNGIKDGNLKDYIEDNFDVKIERKTFNKLST